MPYLYKKHPYLVQVLYFELLKMYGGKAKNGKALGIPLQTSKLYRTE